MKRILVSLIRFYQKFLSPDQGLLLGGLGFRICRFYPSCSQYACEAIDKYGAAKGSFRALVRICRCHPYSAGGYDPVNKN